MTQEESKERSLSETPGAGPADRLRLFIAIALPDETRKALAELSRRLQGGFAFTPCRPSWVKPEAMHLSLRFLGATDPQQVDPLADEIARVAAQCAPIRLKLLGLGVFPHWRRPRVIWAGVSEKKGKRLARLQSELEDVATGFGFEPSPAPFRPHLTLARLRRAKGVAAARKVVESHHDFQIPAFKAVEVVLYRSELHPTGARHFAERRLPLSAEQAAPVSPDDPSP